MKFSEKTLYSEVKHIERYFTAEDKENVLKGAKMRYGDYYELTIEEFFALLDKNFAKIELNEKAEITLFQFYWMQYFSAFVDEFTKILKKFEIAPTAKELQYMQGTMPMTFSESLLIFAQNFFGLKSFKEAEKITLGEIIIAKKADYNKSVFQRNQIKQYQK